MILTQIAAAVDDLESVDAFDPNRFRIVGAFDAAHYHGAATARYPLLGPRQAPTILLSDDDDDNAELIK